jgi:hypothetical protein
MRGWEENVRNGVKVGCVRSEFSCLKRDFVNAVIDDFNP